MSDKPCLILKVYEDYTLESDGGVVSNLILAGVATWAMGLIIENSRSGADREHAKRVLDEITRAVYAN